MKFLQNIFLFFGVAMLINMIMYSLGASSEGMPIDEIFETFPKNKIIVVLISFFGYIVVKHLNSKKI